MEELYSLLPITESIITATNTTSFFGDGSENLSTRQHNSFKPRSRGNSRGRGRGYYRTHHSNYHTSGRGQFNKDPIYYQLCDKACQTAKTCYSRSRISYNNQSSNNNIQGLTAKELSRRH